MIEAALVSTPEGFTNNSTITPNASVSTKKSSAKNHSINLQRHWMSNIRLMFGGSVQLRKSVMKSKKAMCCGQTLKSAIFIQK